MPRTSKLLAAFMVLAAMGCAKPKPGDPPHSKVGVAVAPPPGQTVNYDPSVVGLGAAIGTTVYDSQGVILWLKYAAPLTSWRAVPVSPLVTGDPSQSPGLKAPIGFTVTMNDGSASWVKSTSSDTGWVTNPPTGVPDGGASITVNAPLSGAGTVGSPLAISAIPLTDLATQIQQTFVGNPIGSGTQTPVAMTATQATAALNVATSSLPGLMSAAQLLALSAAQPASVAGAMQFAYSAVIDLVAGATGPYVVIPPTAARIGVIEGFWEIKTTNTATVSSTYSVGANSASFNNLFASQTTAGLHTAAAETLVFAVEISPNPFVDLTTSGLQLNLTSNATATALTARFVVVYLLLPV